MGFQLSYYFIGFYWFYIDLKKLYKLLLWVKAMGCGIVVSEFVLQSRYYVHFRPNTLGKGMNLVILLAMG